MSIDQTDMTKFTTAELHRNLAFLKSGIFYGEGSSDMVDVAIEKTESEIFRRKYQERNKSWSHPQ